MTLVQLRYFQTAARMHNITRAAEALHVSQPSVSAAIRELEAEFGYPLLERRGRGFTLTPNGAAFLAEADRLLAHAGDFRQAMQRLASRTVPLTLGLPPMIGSLLLDRILTSPEGGPVDFHLTITELGRKELLQQLNDRTLDMAFLPHDEPLGEQYASVPVARLETVCCVAAAHPLARRTAITPRDLAGVPLVLFKESFFQTERIQEAFRAAGVRAHILLQTSQLSTVGSLVGHGLAVGFLFRPLAEPLPGVVSIPLIPAMQAEVSLVWRRTYCPPPEHRRFIEHIRALRAPWA